MGNGEIVKVEQENLPAKQSSFALNFSQNDLALIKQTVCPSQDFTDEEFGLFVYTAKSRGLNPLTKQIYAIKRFSNGRQAMTIQTSIDGFRTVAQRSNEYRGQTAPQWCGEDGVWKDVWLDKKTPAAARVGVYRKDFVEPLYAIALFSDYAQYTKDGRLAAMWAKMPSLMLAKCAEALALRKAFPEDLSGLYTNDEMAQADVINVEFEQKPAQKPAIEATAAPKPEPKHESTPETLGIPSMECVIEDVEYAHGIGKNGKEWNRWAIVVDGKKYGTFSQTLAEKAQEFCDSGQAVMLTYEMDGRFLNAIEIEPIAEPGETKQEEVPF